MTPNHPSTHILKNLMTICWFFNPRNFGFFCDFLKFIVTIVLIRDKLIVLVAIQHSRTLCNELSNQKKTSKDFVFRGLCNMLKQLLSLNSYCFKLNNFVKSISKHSMKEYNYVDT